LALFFSLLGRLRIQFKNQLAASSQSNDRLQYARQRERYSGQYNEDRYNYRYRATAVDLPCHQSFSFHVSSAFMKETFC